MKQVHSSHTTLMTCLCAGVMMVVAGGCGAPTAPRAELPASLPGVSAPATYRVSGVVTDEQGVPRPGATVLLEHGPNLPDLNPATLRIFTSTAADGRYEIAFTPAPPGSGIGIFAVLRAWMPRESGLSHISVLDGQGASAVKDIRLQRARTIDAGQSIEIAVGPDSSLCWPRVTTICELVFVRYPTDGTLSVRVEGGAAPTVRWRDDVGEGSLSIPVSTEDFSSAGITLEWPAGTPSQRALMTTSFRPL